MKPVSIIYNPTIDNFLILWNNNTVSYYGTDSYADFETGGGKFLWNILKTDGNQPMAVLSNESIEEAISRYKFYNSK